MTHALKTWPEFFKQVKAGRKNYEIRKVDRPFKVGDRLLLQEWNPDTKQYTGEEIVKHVIEILQGGQFGIMEGYCIMSLEVEY